MGADADLPQLICINLPGCTGLQAPALQALTGLTQLRALSIAACPQLTDASGAGAVLAHLPSLSLLQADSSGLGDSALEALCYGWKLRTWASEAGEHTPSCPASPHQVAAHAFLSPRWGSWSQVIKDDLMAECLATALHSTLSPKCMMTPDSQTCPKVPGCLLSLG